MVDPFADPDYVLDAYRDSLRDDPVPCALCGGTDAPAWRIVALDPADIAYGPVAPARGICDPCFEDREVTRRLDYTEGREGWPEFNGAFR